MRLVANVAVVEDAGVPARPERGSYYARKPLDADECLNERMRQLPHMVEVTGDYMTNGDPELIELKIVRGRVPCRAGDRIALSREQLDRCYSPAPRPGPVPV